ncbi:uncharacterized protein AB675_8441 [Cyphellophora attinorum]|uniref:Uncharacterized protein n=1 Tax=Cyphellophora attinorum TaxID=1664694 RepID=A0A0N1HG29_9EURO|nr:uncharacterized protein AB675_8441 [Phialophora attinorum]KPI44453.1 hypothetical protein AB675_8441 [Phialophora attinorum]
MSRPRGASSPRLEIPRKSVELEDPGATNLQSSEDEYFSDASEGRRRASRPQTPASPIPRTRIERVDDTPAYGEVPGTAAYARRAQDAVPDEVEVTGRLSRRSSQYLEPPTTPGGTLIPRTVVEKVDPSSPSYGEAPGSKGFSHRKADSVPDLVLKAPEPGKRKGPEHGTSPSSGQSPPVPETIVTRVDSNPAYGEVDGTKAKERREKDAEPDVLEVQHESGAQAGADDDFDDFNDDFEQPGMQEQAVPESTQHIYPLIDFNALSDLPELLVATQQHLDAMFPSTTEQALADLPTPPPIDNASPIFPSERSRSLWKQLVTPPPLQPPNWTQSRIRRLFLVSLGVPVDLDEILPPSKQKKLVLPDINLEPPRKSESEKPGSIARLKQQAANDSTASLDSNQSGKEGKARTRRTKGPPPPPDVDLFAVRRLAATTDEKLDGLTQEELNAHVKNLKATTETTAELLEYWLKRRDGLRKEKEAFEGVIENLIRHMRK